MREILFRGKPKHDGEYYFFSQIWKDNCKDGFVCGSLVVDADRYYICVSAMRNINTCINNGMTSMIEVIPGTVGQYTGLTDKNGRKVFEGDVLKFTDESAGYEWIGRVEFGNPNGEYNWGFQLVYITGTKANTDTLLWFDMEESGAYCEVIGNIHDNPELLENP
jgi:uncharacterized phage protein (TIGR01671 family)